MKTDQINFNRLGLLFQRFFIERSRTELVYWSIMAIVFMFLRNNIPGMIGLIVIGGVVYASRFFKEIHYPGNGVAYFMIPATQLEKLIVGIVITSFYYFAMMMITYAAGNLLGTFFNNMLASMNINILFGFSPFHYSPLQWKLLGSPIEAMISEGSGMHTNIMTFLFELFLVGQSIYLLGSIYFKRNQFFATLLATNIIQILLFILFVVELKLFFDTTNLELSNYEWGRTVGHVLRGFIWLLPPFFWVVSYFRLTEKQA